MKRLSIFFVAIVIFAFSCEEDDKNDNNNTSMFTVTIENVATDYTIFTSGVFNTPVGASAPAAATPGESYSFMFHAGKGHKLSFATMYVQSNDLFFAPSAEGIDLYDDSGNPVSGDITSMVSLWDAGTEVNEAPGEGANQAPRQEAANTGDDENGTVQMIADVNDGFDYPLVSDVARFTLKHLSGSQFELTITVNADATSPLAPGVWAVHSQTAPLFTEGMAEPGYGLEALAEDGDPAALYSYLSGMSGLSSPIAPGLFAIHSKGSMLLFEEGMKDWGEGLEALAEDGDPAALSQAVATKTGVVTSGVFNTPTSASSPAPALPGQSYQFTFEASEGDYLSFATMLVQSNDLFYAPDDMGIALFSNGMPVTGNITAKIQLWDAGTEMNEYPGAGANQAPRQTAANTGTGESENIGNVNDGYTYPAVSDIIKVTLTAQ